MRGDGRADPARGPGAPGRAPTPTPGARGALHGDLVESRVVATDRSGRREGSVVRVAGEKGHRVVGLVTRLSPRIEVVPFDGRVGDRFSIHASPADGIAEGVAVEIEIP